MLKQMVGFNYMLLNLLYFINLYFFYIEDLRILNNLVANQDIQRVWSLGPPPIISKL